MNQVKYLKKNDNQIKRLQNEIYIMDLELQRQLEQKRQILRNCGCFILNKKQEECIIVKQERGLYNAYYKSEFWALGLSYHNAICNLIMKLPLGVLIEFINLK